MLGSLRHRQKWQWVARGKHPVAKDFISIGENSEFTKSVADWVDAGFSKCGSQHRSGHEQVAWRFWARGTKKDTLACGLVRDSCDNVGRSYPLLIIGSGSLRNWDRQWDLLPYACEKTWEEIDYLSAHLFPEFKTLQSRVGSIRTPSEEWSAFQSRRAGVLEPEMNTDRMDAASLSDRNSRLLSVSEKTEGCICLNQTLSGDGFTPIVALHYFLREKDNAAPNAVFMGGTLSQTCIAFFRRPLMTDDFLRLWTGGAAYKLENESAAGA